MALEVRRFQFTIDADTIAPLTVEVPADRKILGSADGNGGPMLLVQGDWAAPDPVNVTFSVVRAGYYPYEIQPGESVVAVISDTNYGYSGFVLES